MINKDQICFCEDADGNYTGSDMVAYRAHFYCVRYGSLLTDTIEKDENAVKLLESKLKTDLMSHIYGPVETVLIKAHSALTLYQSIENKLISSVLKEIEDILSEIRR